MNEIEKMYKNAGLSNMWVEEYDDKQFWHGCYNEMIQSMMKLNDWDRKTAISVAHKECRKAHPPFTAEKQLWLIKWLSDIDEYVDIHYDRYKGLFEMQTGSGGLCVCNDFADALASRVNIIWQDLTEEEKEQIRGILK